MTNKFEVYKCDICGNIIEVLHPGKGQLVCCNQPMRLLKEKTEDKGLEKHVPILEVTSDGVEVKVGSVKHPMEENHYIEWIEILADNKVLCRKILAPKEKPEATFKVKSEDIVVRVYCNIHELWKST